MPVAVAASGDCAAYISAQHDLLVWGDGRYGQLGIDEHVHECAAPTVVPMFRRLVVTQVACGATHTLVVADDVAYAFGTGGKGQLGLGRDVHVAHRPTAIASVRGVA